MTHVSRLSLYSCQNHLVSMAHTSATGGAVAAGAVCLMLPPVLMAVLTVLV